MTTQLNIHDLVPHGPEFTLPEEVLSLDQTSITTKFTVHAKTLFINEEGNLPTYTGIEYMAQSIAAFSGSTRLKNNVEIKIGVLLGTRSMEILQDYFLKDESYLVNCKLLFEEDGLGSFDCYICKQSDNQIICKARLNVYQPEEINQILN